MSTDPPHIRVRSLVKEYGAVRAVDDLDLDVPAGEVFALLGPNGAGKTTTTEILEGFRERDGGEVSVLGEDPGRAGRAWRARIGIVLQSSDDYAELTVGELVGHFARYYPRPRDVDEVIDAVGLEPKRNSRVRSLSGGQRRRLDVALGIIGTPELLFLDEPTTGFDPQARRSFWELVRRLRDEGTTILLTTHYLDEAEQLADRVGVIAGGRLVAVDTPARLGGRHEQRARVVWRDGEELTPAPTALVAALSERYAGEVPDLQVLRPTLEDVYLGMIHE
ncbi:ABC transporter ATP-binding protein [Kineosporia succinea]|uniref:ABC-2 type transport system ATP-binding protein n=1 Tax=Kineosporia succinea TaxID=84632 RepID=A0ABT9P522_9ACTN|nr:ABC transporter ATP-binding protein [Kineosporia succinea]MDP9827165.1 ABC-2 type transport system ATP-binding protein [Kineosporia succinea]